MDTWLIGTLVAGWLLMAILGAFIAEWKGHSFGLNLLGGVMFPFLWPLVIPALLDYSESDAEENEPLGPD